MSNDTKYSDADMDYKPRVRSNQKVLDDVNSVVFKGNTVHLAFPMKFVPI